MYPFRFIVGNVPFNMLDFTFYQHCVSLLKQANLLVFFFDTHIKRAYAIKPLFAKITDEFSHSAPGR